MVVYGLSSFQSMILLKSSTRELPTEEINVLLDSYTNSKLNEHRMFKMLGGNPSLILLVAQILADPERSINLSMVYKSLCEQKTEDIMTLI